MNFISGMVAIFTLTNIYRRGKLLFMHFQLLLVTLHYISGLIYSEREALHNINFQTFFVFALNRVLVLISYPLIFIFEKKFLFLSDATLLELADTNQPLLRKLADEAPGSFQHSLQVANLAEEAAR